MTFESKTSAAASNTRELVEALSLEERNDKFFPLNDLPNDVLVSVFAATEDQLWVRHTFPLVCKAWAALYRTKDASPLHETLEVDFERARKSAVAAAMAREAGGRRVPAPGFSPLVHASRVLAWAERRAGSVLKLRLENRGFCEALKYFTASDLAALVAVAASSLTDISIGPGFGDLCGRPPFWESLRTSVVPAGRLRSLVDEGMYTYTFRSFLEPLLGQLAGSLEELVVREVLCSDDDAGLTSLPKSLFALEKLRRLQLSGDPQITAIPAGISSLKNLEELSLRYCKLSSLPKELGALSGLTKLDLSGNWQLWNTPERMAFPAELGNLKSLRVLGLKFCFLRAVPAFVGELKSLESLDLTCCRVSSLPKELGALSGLTKLDLSANLELGNTPERMAFPAELGNMKSLRVLGLKYCDLRAVPAFVGELKSLESLDLESNGILQIRGSAGRDPLDSLIDGCPRLREVTLAKKLRAAGTYRAGGTLVPRVVTQWTLESLVCLEFFKEKLRAKNPDAKVSF